MHARIQRFDDVAAMTDEVIPAGRRVAARLNRVPGFVAYLLLDAGDGVFVGVSVFEDEAGLAADTSLSPQWPVEQDSSIAPGQVHVMSGEVVVQKGL
jgi:hypothetical protein